MSSSGSSGGGLLAWLRGLFGSDDSGPGGNIGTLEGNIGNDGSDKGTAGGATGNPSDSDGGSDGGDQTTTGPGGGGAGQDTESVSWSDIAPSWIQTLGSASVVAGGTDIALSEDPVAFVRAVVSSSLIEAVQMIVGTIASGFLRILFIFVEAFGSAGSSVLGSFGSVGDVLLLIIDTLNNTIATLAASAGPLSPIIVVIIYGGIVVVVAGAVRVALVATGFAP